VPGDDATAVEPLTENHIVDGDRVQIAGRGADDMLG
jgi:hypothetical protein